MSKREKLIESILDNPKNVRFDDACKVAKWIGFTGSGGKGSHNGFARPGEMEQLNFQNRDGKIKPYQAEQLGNMIKKYWKKPEPKQKTPEPERPDEKSGKEVDE